MDTLQNRIEARGLGIGETAERAGVRRETLWRWITGRSVPMPKQARALARVLQRRGEETLDETTLWVLSTSRRAVASYESRQEPAAF